MADFVLAGKTLTQMTLTGHGKQDQHHLSIQVQITIIPAGQVREMPPTVFGFCLFDLFFLVTVISNYPV